MTRTPRFARFALDLAASVVALGLAGTGCGNSVNNDDCRESEEDCTGMCFVGNEAFDAGDLVPGECGQCICQSDGSLACPDTACSPPTCLDEEGLPHEFGTVWYDDCNECTCEESGSYSCEQTACLSGCTYGGVEYDAGESFPAIDGCNTCTCGSDGSVGCTERACACDPESEWWRDYVALTPAECAVIDYACAGNLTPFSNECGCGCEQSAECPESFDCQPPTECDFYMIQSECPYSTILL